jgi:hypothetical protein
LAQVYWMAYDVGRGAQRQDFANSATPDLRSSLFSEERKGQDCSWPLDSLRSLRASEAIALVVHREVQSNEPRTVDAGRGAPAARPWRVVRALDVGRVVTRRVVRVEHVVHVDADVHARATEPQDLREAHVDLHPAIVGIDAMLVVG